MLTYRNTRSIIAYYYLTHAHLMCVNRSHSFPPRVCQPHSCQPHGCQPHSYPPHGCQPQPHLYPPRSCHTRDTRFLPQCLSTTRSFQTWSINVGMIHNELDWYVDSYGHVGQDISSIHIVSSRPFLLNIRINDPTQLPAPSRTWASGSSTWA